MSDLINQLHDAVTAITPLVLSAEHAHMKQPWQMILGGLIIPEIVKLDPKVLDSNPGYKKLLAQYDKKKVAEFFTEKIVEKVVEKIVEKPVTKEKIVHVPTGNPVVVAGKVRYRRLKDDGVKKISRLEREIMLYDRDVIITWWNDNQRLVPDDDPVCKALAEEINIACTGSKPIAAAQIAGYFSHLCRMGLCSADYRTARFKKNMELKNITVMPVYSEKLLKEIKENNVAEKADEIAMKAAHEKMRAAKATGSHLKVGTPVDVVKTETAVEPTPAAPVASIKEEEFDIKYM